MFFDKVYEKVSGLDSFNLMVSPTLILNPDTFLKYLVLKDLIHLKKDKHHNTQKVATDPSHEGGYRSAVNS